MRELTGCGRGLISVFLRVIATAFFLTVLALPCIAGDGSSAQLADPDYSRTELENLTGEERVDALISLARKSIRSNPDFCRENLLEAYDYSREIKFEMGVARANNGLGVVDQLQGDYSRGLDYFRKALAGFESLDNKEGEASALQNISSVQLNLDLLEEAMETCRRALALRRELGDEVPLAKSIRGLSVIYRDMGEFEKALDYSLQYLDFIQKFDDDEGLVRALSTIGTIQSELGRDKESLISSEKAVTLARTLDDPYGLGVALSNQAEIFLNVEMWDEAVVASKEVLLLGEGMKVKNLQKIAHHVLAQAYEKVGLTELALEHYHKYRALKSEMFSEETSLRIAELTARFDVARDRNRLLELEKERVETELKLEVERRQRDIFLVGFSISLPLAILTFVLFRRAQVARGILAVKAVELETALGNLRTMEGLVPICASCKNIRDDEGYWHQVEAYVTKHSRAQFSHGICPDCAENLYGDILKDES